MSETDLLQSMERFSELNLTPNEMEALSGIDYHSLPEIFSVNPRIDKACENVWNSKPSRGVSQGEAVRRAREHFLKKQEPDLRELAESHLKALQDIEGKPATTEFGQQFYRLGNEVVVGRIHEGKRNSVLLRNRLDGIHDSKSIVHIHKHPNDLPQSFDDLMGILVDDDRIPKKCLYYIVGPSKLHLMFPTNDSPMTEIDNLRSEFDAHKNRYIRDTSLEYSNFAAELARDYKLGFYSSPRGDNSLDRIT